MGDYIYFDNAATTFPKPESVVSAGIGCIRDYCANSGRSTHRLAIKTANAIYNTREKISEYLSFDAPEQVIFTPNATFALNIAIKGLIDHPCHVITSDFEHNSVIRPLYSQSQKVRLRISHFDTDSDIEESISGLINADTEFLVTSLVSNVTGKQLPIDVLYKVSKKYRLKTIIDASQLLGHQKISLSAYPFDIVCAPGHKALFGFQGSGFMVSVNKRLFESLVHGGSGSDSLNLEMPDTMPEHYEAGTLNTPAIVSLCAGIEYLDRIGDQFVRERLDALTARMNDILLDCGSTVYGCSGGIASFNLGDITSVSLARMLDEGGIAVRSGLHCAPMVHKKLGTDRFGTVRASLSVLNTEKELDRLYIVLKEIKRNCTG